MNLISAIATFGPAIWMWSYFEKNDKEALALWLRSDQTLPQPNPRRHRLFRIAVTIIWLGLGLKFSDHVGAPLVFTLHGYPCITCNGHIAGYRWAERESTYEDVNCSNPSKSFREGCRVYLNGWL